MLLETLEYLGIAFVCSAALIVMSKIILQFLIRRPADYYNAAEEYQEEMMLNSAGFSITEEIETNPEGELTDHMIHVTPKISAGQILDMHLLDEEHLKEFLDKHPDKQAQEPSEEKIPSSLEEIRKSLEEAYQQQQEDEQKPQEKEPEKEPEPAPEPEPTPEPEPVPEKPAPKKTRKRKPSMKMKKAELTEIALSMDIEIPEKATKQIILDLIREKQQQEENA